MSSELQWNLRKIIFQIIQRLVIFLLKLIFFAHRKKRENLFSWNKVSVGKFINIEGNRGRERRKLRKGKFRSSWLFPFPSRLDSVFVLLLYERVQERDTKTHTAMPFTINAQSHERVSSAEVKLNLALLRSITRMC